MRSNGQSDTEWVTRCVMEGNDRRGIVCATEGPVIDLDRQSMDYASSVRRPHRSGNRKVEVTRFSHCCAVDHAHALRR